MNRLFPLSFIAACAPAVAPTVSEAPAPTPAEAPRERDDPSEAYPPDMFGVLWRDAALYRHPDDTAPMRAWDFGERSRDEQPGAGFVVRLLERRGPWRRVASVSHWRDEANLRIHCVADGVQSDGRLELHLWVRAEDLMPVVTQTQEQRYEDGSYAVVEPGTPVANQHPWADGFLLPISVDPDAIGEAYHPERSPARSALADAVLEHAHVPDLRVSLGGQAVQWTEPLGVFAESHAVRIEDERARVVWDRCGAAEFILDGEYTLRGGLGGIYGTLGESKPQPAGAIEAGTRLLWPDGRPAGSATDDVVRTDLAPTEDALTCMHLPLGWPLRGEGSLGTRARVCVETNQIQATTTTDVF